jgi:poly(3-hydroxybutyrate) depolymerase
MSRTRFWNNWNLIFATTVHALEAGEGYYQYKDRETDKILNVWYYKPDNFTPRTPIVIVLHGSERKANVFRDTWMPHAKTKDFMLLAPEFSLENFPGNYTYNLGNHMTADKHARPKAEWSFMIIERIFDDFIKLQEKSDAQKYYLYGHSAGAQFVHRLMLFVPEARVKLAISANAGYYIIPDFSVTWPYGLDKTNLDKDSVCQYFSKPLILLLGEEDTNPLMLPRGPNSDNQGIMRLERGYYFFHFAKGIAEKLEVPFIWQMQTVPNAGHDDKPMAEATVEIFAKDMIH